jgi:hypothetical protein
MFEALRYYWVAASGYRFCPWKSPYLRWRLETFLGKEAADLDAGKFFRICWRERARLESFLNWAAERRAAQKRRK